MFDPAHGASTLVELLRRRGAEQADALGYVFLRDGEEEESRHTYGELDAEVRCLAARLQAAGAAGERVVLLFPPGIDFVTAFFACLYAGAVAVPAYPPRPRKDQPRLRAIAEDAKPRVVLTTATILARTAGWVEAVPDLAAATWIALDEPHDLAPEAAVPEDWREPSIGPDTLAFLQYTSGSTSTPKGVMVGHGNLLHNESLISRGFGHRGDELIVGWLPLYHDMGLIGNVLQPLYLGVPCVLMAPLAFLQQPLRWLRAIDRYRATTSGGPNFAYELCVAKTTEEQRAELDLSTWRVAFNGAEPVRADTLERFADAFAASGFRRPALFPCYGLAEATLFVTGAAPGTGVVADTFDPTALGVDRAVARSAEEGGRTLVSSGRVAADTDLRIVDPSSAEVCADGRVGEIWIAGPSVAGGYWRRPELSAETFGARVAGEPEAGPFLRTGDLGFQKGGELFVTGRIKDLLILRGRNYYPQDVELAAERSHPALRSGSAAAFAVEQQGEERLVVAVELERRREDEAEAAAEAVRRAVSDELELPVQEVVLVRAGTIPKTSSGKIQRHACRRAFLDGSLFVVGRSALAEEVAAGAEVAAGPALDAAALRAEAPEARRELLVGDLRRRAARLLRLPAEKVPADEPVTALGLDSLAAVELGHELETAFGAAPTLAELLGGPSLETLAEELLARLDGGASGSAPERIEAGTGEETEELSAGERALWFLDRLAHEAAAYNVVAAARLPADTRFEALTAAVRDLVARHPALRTTFHDHRGEPARRVRESLEPDVEIVAAGERDDAAVQRALGEEAFRPFDLETGPLLRVRVWTRGEEPALLLLAVHHLVSDFWSLAVMLEELGALYGHHATGETVELEALPLRYEDFARWQRRMLAGPRGEESWSYWRERLGGELPALDLPLDRPRPRLQSHAGAAVAGHVPAPLVERLEALARSHGATSFMLLLTAYQLLLARWSGQTRVVVGTPTAGRPDPRLRQLVGYFVNPVAVVQEIDGDEPFAALLDRARQRVLEAYEHQDFPFPLLAERLQPERDPSRSPIFQALFVLQRALRQGQDHLGAFALGVPGAELALGALRLESLAVSEHRSQFDLSLALASAPEASGSQGLAMVLEYNRDLFDEATAGRLLGHFERLLESIADDPTTAAGDLELMPEAERRQLLVEWNATAAEVHGPRHLLELFEEQVRRTPEATAVERHGEVWSYARLDTRAEELARALGTAGLPPRGRVGVCLDRRPELVAALLATWKAGGAYVPLDPAYPRERLDFMLEDSTAAVLLTEERHRGLFGTGGYAVLSVDGVEAGGGGLPVPRSHEPGHLAYVIYTSGSTGRPKGVAIEHRSAAEMVHWAAGVFSADELAGVLAATSVCFDLSVFELFLPLATGGRVILASHALELAELPGLAELPEASSVTLINTVPSAMTELLRLGAVPPSVRTVNLAGEPLKESLVEEIYRATGARRVYNLYGPSEDTTYSTFALQRAGAGRAPGIGRPVANTRAYLLDRRRRPVPAGVAGELFLGGAGLARGYLGRPALTAERFLPDPFAACEAGEPGGEAGSRLYRTGDLARWTAGGELDFLGRIDHQVKVRGFRIELGEIEAALLAHPAVSEAVVTTRRGAAGEAMLAGYAAAPELAGPEAVETLRDHLRRRLPEFMVPGLLVVLPALPLLPNGKVDRKALAALDVSRLAGDATAVVAPRTEVEERLATLFAELLGLDTVGVEDDFFRGGGHSLLATRLVARVREALDVDLPLSAVFEAPTVATLGRRVEELRASAASAGERIPRLPSGEAPPLSEAQRRLWFLDRLDPGNPAYNLPAAVHLAGPLEPRALAAALTGVVARHDSLRSTFPEPGDTPGAGARDRPGGEPVVHIAEPAPVALPVIDLGRFGGLGAAPEVASAIARKLAERFARCPFDLRRGPLLRAVLLRFGARVPAAQIHTLLVALHHVIADGWSVDVFQRELSAFYRAEAGGEPSALAPLPIQYGDYAAWQRRRLTSGALDAQVEHWRRRLAGAPPVLELPTDRPRPAVKTYAGGSWPVALAPAVVERAEALAAAAGATPFALLLAAWAVLLGRLSGQRELVLGTPIANRDRVEVEGLVGFFVNTLPLRLDLAGDPSFEVFAERVRATALDAFAHPEVPFERLVEELQPRRDGGRDPLVQAVFVLQDEPGRSLDLALDLGLDLGPVTARVEELTNDTAKFELTLFLETRFLETRGGSRRTGGGLEERGGLGGRLEYNRDLFDATRAARLVRAYAVLVEAALAAPATPLSQLPWLAPAERHQVLVEWRRPSREELAEEPEAQSETTSVAGLFHAAAALSPAATALVWDGGELSYRGLAARVHRLARHLRRLGVARGHRVGVCAERSPELVTALLAVLEVGAAYVPLNAADPRERLELMVEDTGLELVLATAESAGAVPAGPRVVVLDRDADAWQELPAEPLARTPSETESAPGPGPDDLAYIAYTSGSTGRPKGVAVPHRAVVRLVRGSRFADLGPSQVFLQLAPVSFDASTLELWAPLTHGGRLVLMPPGAPSLEELGAALVRHGVTTLWLTAGLFHLMVDERLDDLAGVRQLLAGGDALSPARVRRVVERLPGTRLINGYGPTENTTFTTCHAVASAADLTPDSVPIGRPIHRTEVLVLDDAGAPVPVGVGGELLAGGAGLARGYWQRPALTAERFVPHPAPEHPGERLYRTGDRVRWLADGSLDFLGRLDHQVKIRGFRIEPGEVEAVLAAHPAVARAVVLVDGATEDRRLVAFAVPRASQEVLPAELRAHLERSLPAYMVPSALAVVDEIPLTANGKVDRRALLAALPEASPEAGRVAPRTPQERLLAEIWREVLGLEEVGVEDDFFELGGHSLLATRVASRVREAFGVELPLRELFERPTVALLAEVLVGEGAAELPPVTPGLAGEAPPLSFAQARLWFLDRLEKGNPAYNLPAAVHLDGELRRPALAAALEDLVARQESLRTTFAPAGLASGAGEPVQVIHPPAPVPLPVVDLSCLDPAVGRKEARALARREARRPFDLERGPLLRARLLVLGELRHTLLLNLHHVIADGWSVEVLRRDLGVFYAARAASRWVAPPASVLAPLPVRYADYAVWQQRWLEGGALEHQLEHWRRVLGGGVPVLDLPADRSRPAVQSYRGRTLHFRLESPLTAAVDALARRAGATPFMVLLAGFATLLSRYSGQRDLTIGSPVANRDQRAVEDLIGFFVNTLVLRLDLSGEPSFLDLVARARGASLGAYGHQHVPFERLVEELQPQRDRSHSPLFQVMFVLQEEAPQGTDLEGLEMRLEPLDTGTSKFDLTLFLERSAGGLDGRLEYARDLFDAPRIERLAGHLSCLLASAVAQPGERVSRLELLTGGERAQLLSEWTATGQPEPGPHTLPALFAAQVERTPEAEALAWCDGALTYCELARRTGELAGRLRALGVGPEVRVAVCLHRGPELVVALLAVLEAGGAYVPLDPAYPRPRLALMLEDSGSAVLVTEESCLGLLGEAAELPPTLVLDREPAAEASAASAAPVPALPGNLAYLIYTSGSTGRPKGVAIEHRSAAALVHWARRTFSGAELEGVLAATSVCFDLSVFELFVPLCCGGRVMLAEDALDFASLPRAGEVTLINTVPSAMAELLRLRAVPPSVRTVNLAGEPLTRALTEEIFATGTVRRVLDLYGPSEDTTYSTLGAQTPGDPRPPAIGRPLPNTRAYLLDRGGPDGGGQPVPVGVPGELFLAGDGLARGYLGRPALTAERFVPDPFAKTAGGGRLYRTGDLARWRGDGELDFLGRIDHQVKVRGFRIELGEIEAGLVAHPTVREAVVIVRAAGAPGGPELVAFAVPETGHEAPSKLLAEELRRHLRERLPAHMVPAAVRVLAALPLLPNGKVDRKGLAARGPEGPETGGAVVPVAPRTPTEALLVDLWSELLDGRPVGVHDDFFELGGHSLLAARMVARVRDALEVELELPEVFDEPTVARLAERLTERQGAGRLAVSAPPLVPVPRQGTMTPSPAQQRMWLLDRLDPGSAAYNLPAAVHLRGPLAVAAFTAALAEIVRRHETLRTVFQIGVGGEPVQVVRGFHGLVLPVIDLSALEPEHRDALAGELILAEARRGFDLAAGPLLRVRLLRRGAEDHSALFTLHHAVADGWSVGVLQRELAVLYGAFTSGGASPLEPLPVQYADYAAWQHRLLEGPRFERQLGFWRQRLAGLPVLDLPADRPRPASGVRVGSFVPVALPASLVERLEELGRRAGVTLFMTLLAGFETLLARYTGQTDLAVGSPVAGRGKVEIEGLIGLFVNTLVLRTELGGAPSFRELLGRVRHTCVEAYAHQELPFERLVDELRPDRDLSTSPLFQVMFMLQPAAAGALELPGLEVRVEEPDTGSAKFDLSLSLVRTGGALEGRVEYSRELFDRDRIERLVGHLTTLLDAAAADPERDWTELPLLTETEYRQLLGPWAGDLPVVSAPARLDELFARSVRRHPEATALVAGGEILSYAELAVRAELVTQRLRAQGVAPETRVGVCLERGADLVATLLGVLAAGCAYVPLDPAYPEERLTFMLEDSAAAVLVTRAELLPLFAGAPESCRRWCLDAEEPAELAAASSPSLPRALRTGDPRHLAYVIYTSGSTGRPKGVAIEHAAASAMVAWAHGRFGAEELAGVAAVTSVCFDLSVFELFVPLTAGGTVIVESDALALAVSPHRDRVRLINTVPSAIAELLRQGAVPASVITVNLAGEPLQRSLVDALYDAGVTRVFNLYGPSEDTTYSTWALQRAGGPAPPIGRPLAGSRAYVLGRRGQAMPQGVPGELYLGGAGLARGYLGRPALTAERWLPDPFSSGDGAGGGRLYRTGDLVRWGAGGELDFLGRIDHQVKVRGFRIELGEVEAALLACPGVEEATVLALGSGGERRLVGYVGTGREAGDEVAGPAVTGAQLRRRLLEALPEFMVPSLFVVLEALPQLPNGKVDRKALAAFETGVAGVAGTGAAYAPPRTPVEEMLAELWARLLGVERVGIHDSFFELGGHSLLAAQVIAAVRRTLGVELPLRRLFEHPTLAQLAAAVEAEREAPVAPPLVPQTEPETGWPLSFAQERLWFFDQLEPGNAAYDIPAAYHLDGALDGAALEAALAEIVRRHAVLRTTYALVDGRPVQRPGEPGPVALGWADLRSLDETAVRREAEALARREASRPFDLARGPVLRVAVLRLAADRHLLVLNLHHIAGDGWSVGIFFAELDRLYAAFRAGHGSPEPPLASLPVQYTDYAQWQRGWLHGEVLETQLEHWRGRLAGVPVLQLPADRPRPPVRTWRGALRRRLLAPESTARLDSFARGAGGTRFMVLAAVFTSLLARYSRQEDVAVGTPSANRDRAEVEGLIGFFVNTLVLRADLSGGPSLDEAVARLKEVCLDAFSHQDLPFERLVDELAPERSLAHSPLFQVMFTVLGGASGGTDSSDGFGALRLEGLTAQALDLGSDSAKFDLMATLERRDGGWVTWLGYNTDLFDETTALRLMGHLETLLRGALDEPQRPLAEIELLAPAERHQAAVEWAAGALAPAPTATVPELFRRRAASDGAAPALLFTGHGAEDRLLSFVDLDGWAGHLAERLVARGVGPGVAVGLCVARGPEMLAATLGVWQAGGAFVPLDPSYPAERLAFMCEDSAPALVVTTTAVLEALPQELRAVLPAVLLVDEIREEPVGAAPRGRPAPSDYPGTQAGLDDLAYRIYTSGTTGQPKAVEVSHANLAHTLTTSGERFGFGPGDVMLYTAAYSFDISLFESWGVLLGGGAVDLVTHEQILEVEPLVERLERVTLVHTVPTLMRQLVAHARSHGERRFDHVRRVFLGGDAVPADLLADVLEIFPRARVEVLYGPTEGTIICSSYAVPRDGSAPGVRGLLGRPLPGAVLRLLDAGRRPVPAGVPGEIYIGGPGVTRGYFDRPELTAERFVEIGVPAGVGAGAVDRWYRTGDLARWLADGHLEFLGRSDHQVKVRGFRIELGEIETALRAHPLVAEAVVVARLEESGDRRLVAYAVPVPGQEAPTTAELRHHLESSLAEYMVPAVFMLLDELPLSPTGKVRRDALPAPEAARPALEGELRAPSTPREQILAEIWAQVLGLERVGVDEGFFELGGDSILSIQVVARAQQAGLKITAKQIFEHQTVAKLALVAEAAAHLDAEQGPVSGEAPLTPIQRRFFAAEPEDAHHFTMPLLFALRQALEPRALAGALAALAAHHDALRLRFARDAEDGSWRQRHAEPEPVPLHVVDLTALALEHRRTALERTAAGAQGSLDLDRGPLFRALLFPWVEDDLGDGSDAGRLLLVAHHLVVDGVSWRVLIEDLHHAYDRLRAGETPRLPPKTTSYRGWAERLESHAGGAALAAEAPFWIETCRAVAASSPWLSQAASSPTGSAEPVATELSEESTRALLHEVHEAYGTRVPDLLLTALARAVAAETGVPALAVALEGHGREELFEDADVSRTVGWFTSVYPVVLDLAGRDEPGEALKAVKERLRSVPSSGVGYGLLRYGAGLPELAAAPEPQVAFNYLGQLDQALPEGSPLLPAVESAGPARSPRQRSEHALSVDAQVSAGRFRARWSFAPGLLTRERVESLGRVFVEQLEALIAHCLDPHAGGFTASDFALTEMGADELLDAFGEIEFEEL